MKKNVTETSVQFWNVSAKFIWEPEIIAQIASKKRFPGIPWYHLLDKPNIPSVTSLHVKYWSTASLAFSSDKTEWDLVIPQSEFAADTPIISVQTVLEYFRNIVGSMTLHASAVRIRRTGEWVIFFGRQWSGKTTMLLDLCRRWVAELIGNDYVIIEWLAWNDYKPVIRHWTTDIHLRLASVQDHFPELVDLFPTNNSVAPFRLKQFVTPEKLWIKVYKGNLGALIHQSYFINVRNDIPILYSEVLDKKSAEWQYVLPENASRLIRGTGQRILWKNGHPILSPIDSDGEETYFKRENMIDTIMKHTFSLTGNRKNIWDYILGESQ